MPQTAQALQKIQKYFVTWLTELEVAGALDLFDINKVSEGTARRLLDLLFGRELKDLNDEQRNFPAIDLGDPAQGLAYQVTTRSDAAKIRQTLEAFSRHGLQAQYPRGVRFIILNSGRRPRLDAAKLNDHIAYFNPATDIYRVPELIRLIGDLYDKDPERYQVIEDFLAREFGGPLPDRGLLPRSNDREKLEFYQKLFKANYTDPHGLVPFQCRIGVEYHSTDTLPERLLAGKGAVIAGPSGCGKSALARSLALGSGDIVLPVLLAAKYYLSDLNSLFEKEARAYGFDSAAELLAICRQEELRILLIIDGLNECAAALRPKLLLEAEKLLAKTASLLLITTQQADDALDALGLTLVRVGLPEQDLKKAIAARYADKKFPAQLDPVLEAVSSSLEAKMVGELSLEQAEDLSRFGLFERFIRRKLGQQQSDGALLLAAIAASLSRQVTFHLTERAVAAQLRQLNLPGEVYRACLAAGLLEDRLGRVTFGHEMFFNFFVADSIARFAEDAPAITAALEAPRNHDKKLLIIGAIEDDAILNQVLQGLTDAELIVSLHGGEGGQFAQLWARRRAAELLTLIREEAAGLQFEFSDEAMSQMRIRSASLRDWTTQELAVIHALPYLFVRDLYLREIFAIVGQLDEVISAAVTAFREEARAKGFSARSAIFAAVYNPFWAERSAIGRISADLHSGFTTFRQRLSVSEQTVRQLAKGSLKFGQLYLWLLILRYDDLLFNLYGYFLQSLRNWRGIPYHLLTELLQYVPHSYQSDEQRLELIAALQAIHAETGNAWLSTMLFDALGAMGALDEDAANYTETVVAEIDSVLARPLEQTAWDQAAGIYYAQFDHPYDSAYSAAIGQLEGPAKQAFYTMALQGYYSSMFTISLIRQSWELLGAAVAPPIVRWTAEPMREPSFPQDSLGIFLISHIFLAKCAYPLKQPDWATLSARDRSLHAAAQIYYELNQPDREARISDRARELAEILFAPDNPYVIATVWEFRHIMGQSGLYHTFEPGEVRCLDEAFPEMVTQVCRLALTDLAVQRDLLDFPRGRDDIPRHAIHLLERSGSVLDLDVLRPLTDHPDYGRDTVEAIRRLSN